MNKAGEGIWSRGGSVPSSEALTGKVHHLSLIEWSPRDRVQVQVASLQSAQTVWGCASTSLSLSFAIRASGGVRGRSGDPGGAPSTRWAFEHGSCSRYFYQTCTCCQLWGAGSVCGGDRGTPTPLPAWAQRKPGHLMEPRHLVWPWRGHWDWPWRLVPFPLLPRHTLTPSSSGLLQTGSQASSKGPGGGGGPAGHDLPWNKLTRGQEPGVGGARPALGVGDQSRQLGGGVGRRPRPWARPLLPPHL